ncbi:hypothetical protein [Kitasatospora sp. P5_F3]
MEGGDPGVAQEGGGGGDGESGGDQVEPGQQAGGQIDFVVRQFWVGEGKDEGAPGLEHPRQTGVPQLHR